MLRVECGVSVGISVLFVGLCVVCLTHHMRCAGSQYALRGRQVGSGSALALQDRCLPCPFGALCPAGGADVGSVMFVCC